MLYSEAVVQRCSVKKVFLKFSQGSQENTCTLCENEFCEIFKNVFYRTSLVAASAYYFILYISFHDKPGKGLAK